jgi:two-component system NtrC family sensor kinase
MAAVQVIDQGNGIPGDKLPHVFEPFYTDRKGGTGLGLALVKHFIENMGGTVQIWNNEPPPGCTVEVRIPRYPEELP